VGEPQGWFVESAWLNVWTSLSEDYLRPSARHLFQLDEGSIVGFDAEELARNNVGVMQVCIIDS